ncbi:hypothetical protein LMG8526_1459 [Lactococcus lactis subsp. lactis]|nr:hypothetical protein LMG8526_1459 [Lactococcus lactis subsp. lactis]
MRIKELTALLTVLSVKFTDRIHFHPLLALTVDWGEKS